MPGGKVTVPGTLSGHAAEIYRSAFASAYSDTCKDRGDGRDACAAKVAWSAVKNVYKKGDDGKWVEKCEGCGSQVVELIDRKDYPWDECIADQMKQYDDMEKAKKVCGAIKAKQGKSFVEQGGDAMDDNLIVETFEAAGIDVGKVPLPGSLYESPRAAGETWIAAYNVRHAQTQDMAASANFAWATMKDRFEANDAGLWVAKAEPESQPEPEVSPTIDETYMVQRSPRPGNWTGGDIVIDGLTPDQEAALIQEGYAGELAACPVGVDVLRWIEMPAPARTVGAVIRAKREARAYRKAIEKYVEKHGFKAVANPSRTGEVILTGAVKLAEAAVPYTATGVLTRRIDQDASDAESWQVRALSRGPFTGGSTTLRVPVGEIRFRGPMLK